MGAVTLGGVNPPSVDRLAQCHFCGAVQILQVNLVGSTCHVDSLEQYFARVGENACAGESGLSDEVRVDGRVKLLDDGSDS